MFAVTRIVCIIAKTGISTPNVLRCIQIGPNYVSATHCTNFCLPSWHLLNYIIYSRSECVAFCYLIDDCNCNLHESQIKQYLLHSNTSNGITSNRQWFYSNLTDDKNLERSTFPYLNRTSADCLRITERKRRYGRAKIGSNIGMQFRICIQ